MKNRELIRDQLISLAKSNSLTPNKVLQLAEDPSNPMHECFTWNNDEAAHRYRLDQARDLISSFEITVNINRVEIDIQQFVHDPSKDENEQGYVPISSIKSESDQARELMRRELLVAKAHLDRTERFAAVCGFQKDIRRMSGRFQSLIESVDDSGNRQKTK